MAGATYSDAYRKLVAVLREARLEQGLQQAELAALIGKDQWYISNIERAHRRVDLLEFYAIARAMKLDPTKLFGRMIADLPEVVEI